MRDLVKDQYHRIARQPGFYGIMPDRIGNAWSSIRRPEFWRTMHRAIFLMQTPNGERVQRRAESFGFSVTLIEKRANAVDDIAHIDNRL